MNAKTVYGAFELKRCYQRHMLISTLGTILLMVLLVATGWALGWHQSIVQKVDEPEPPGGDFDFKNFGDRPEIEPSRPLITPSSPHPRLTGTITGRPEPVPMSKLDEPEMIIVDNTPTDFPPTTSGVYSAGEGNGNGNTIFMSGSSGHGKIPPPGTFIPVEQMPVMISMPQPEYPKLAREAGISAMVYVQAFVDKNGKVLRAEAVKCDHPDIGFEDSARRAALKARYRPAIQNGHPIGVWITYKVKFVLE